MMTHVLLFVYRLARAKEAGTSSSSEQRQKLAELTRELLVAQRAAKSADSDKRAMEVRLHRALEESSKYKVRGETNSLRDLLCVYLNCSIIFFSSLLWQRRRIKTERWMAALAKRLHFWRAR
jgi:hypothetical protein